MSKRNKKQFAELLQAVGEQASLRAQEAIRSGITFEHFKKIADDSVIPKYESVLAGNSKKHIKIKK
jgi:hypothetical protein